MFQLPGPPPIEISLRRNARARRFSLRVSQATGAVTLSLPTRAREAEAMAFARAQEGWIRAALARMPVASRVGIGCDLPFEGKILRLQAGPGRSVRVEGDLMVVPGDPQRAAARISAFLKVQARNRLVAASDHYAGLIGRKVSQVTLRDTRSRWGSCTSDGALMYSWRLIMAPPRVLDYVAAHEVAHMLEMNHSDRFWAVVQRLFPGWQAERSWLKREGGSLQAMRFDLDDTVE
ncbi:zinc metalloprotease [Cypionkella aquatica]|uniref:Zinc metalloprotease n=1 Tax=Cypionkella aquatica TaxID=1756042 RepID=A0AA37X5N4_9RHOB|nr:SprT family zinc-dependent metalloprotease [Cypionkella aquatica]GLS88101.1 zinc metalloprotease [Cypionkella aquatica]